VLKDLRYTTENYRRLCVIGSEQPDEEMSVNSCNVAGVETYFDVEEYKTKSESELQEFFISLLLKGLSNLEEQLAPIEKIKAGIETFRNEGYKNNWIHKSKKIKGTKLKASLHCNLTMNEFKLVLSVADGNDVKFEKQILETAPDEIAFQHKFKDIVFKENNVLVVDKLGGVLFELPINEVI